jgi:hypothetical protein
MDGWIEEVNDAGKCESSLSDLGMCYPDAISPYTQCCIEHLGAVHKYCKGADGTGYNFIWEWTPCEGDGRAATGVGYFFCAEF